MKIEKVVSDLPSPLEPDTVYLVRTGQGYTQFVTDSTGGMAHSMNLPSGGGSGPRVERVIATTDQYGSLIQVFTPAFSTPHIQATVASLIGGFVNVIGVYSTSTETTLELSAQGIRQELSNSTVYITVTEMD